MTTYTPQAKYNGQHAADLSEYVFGKVQPQALPLEEAVLGAIMIDREALPAVIDILKPESFYTAAHQAIYSACLSLFAKSDPVDLLTLANQMRTDGTLESCGGGAYLVELTNRVASSANLEYHARIVAQKALQRDLIQAANETIKAAYDETTDAFDLLTSAQTTLYNLANFGGRMPESVSRIGIEVVKLAAAAMNKPDGITGVPCGLAAIDKTTGGWQPTDLVILAARPGMGKTAFVLNAAIHAAREGVGVAFFSLEMSKKQLVNRIVAIETGISANNIQRGKIKNDDLRRMAQAAENLPQNLFIDDTPGLNIFELRAKARRLKMQHGIGFVIVDYLQLMAGERERGSNREQEISSISRGLKNLAKDLEVPVIALSQLSRAVETRGGSKRPQLSDLRESGAIEQDADLVAFLYRPEYYGIETQEDGSPTNGFCELIVAKHRHGALDDIGIYFDGPTTKFSDLSAKHSNQFPTSGPAITTAALQEVPANARPNLDDHVPF